MPLFVYGLFKPGELCYWRIEDFVESRTEAVVNAIIKERDGTPLLEPSSYGKVKGYLLTFRPGSEATAYINMSEIDPDKLYKWETIEVDGQGAANVLEGKSLERGANDFSGGIEPIEGLTVWRSKDDPLFKDGLSEVQAILDEYGGCEDGYKPIFRLQMAYMLLWSAIERYTSLKYHLGGRATNKVLNIACERCFKESLQRHVKEGKDRSIYSAVDLERYTLNPTKPRQAVKYYYQVRSNAAHRGKASRRDFGILKSALEELLAIFRDVLGDVCKD